MSKGNCEAWLQRVKVKFLQALLIICENCDIVNKLINQLHWYTGKRGNIDI